MATPVLHIRTPAPRDVTSRDHLGDERDAARIAGVKVGTIRVWKTRGKLTPVIPAKDGAPDLYHLPTVALLAADPGRRKHTPADPAANARGPRRARAA